MEKRRKTLLELCEEAGYPIKKRKKKKIEGISTRENFTDCHCENRRNRDDDEFY